MVRNLTAALITALVLGSVGTASAQTERYVGGAYTHSQEQFCYLPSSPCDDDHSETN